MELAELSKLKKSLGKFAQSELLLLSEAAEKLKMTEEYLLGLVRRGQVKSFKVGEHWFVEEKWLDDFRASMRQAVHLETVGHNGNTLQHRQGWTRPVASRKRRIKRMAMRPEINFKPFFVFAAQTVVASVVLACVGIGLGLACLPLARLSLNRQAIANNFFAVTYRVYILPTAAAARLSSGKPINDEKLTHSLYRLAGQQPPGQVAGAYEKKIDR